jgi:hypothetical protein
MALFLFCEMNLRCREGYGIAFNLHLIGGHGKVREKVVALRRNKGGMLNRCWPARGAYARGTGEGWCTHVT